MRMTTPSGHIFDEHDLEIMKLMNRYGSVRYEKSPIILESGIQSNCYVMCRQDVTDHPDLEWALGSKIARKVRVRALNLGDKRDQCLIGVPTAGTTLAQAAAMVGAETFGNLRGGCCHRVMREHLKEHGVNDTWVHGKPVSELQSYWLVDNAITTGNSMFRAMDKLKQDEYRLEDIKIFILIDRQQGGVEALRATGFGPVIVGYELLDVVHVFYALGYWPESALKAVQEEISAYQL